MVGQNSQVRPVDIPLLTAKKLWRLFSSLRLALFLILTLVALGLVGTLLIQAPAEVTVNAADYGWWVQYIARPKFGVWADILSFLRLFDIFHSPWFLTAGGLLIINILFCTLNRWKNIRIMFQGTKTQPAVGFFHQGKNSLELSVPSPSGKVSHFISDELKKRRYRVWAQQSGEIIQIAASKNRFSPAGSYLVHLSLILFVLGFIISSFWGFREPYFFVPEGSTRSIGHNTGLSLELNSFETKYWPDGSPEDYRSQVVLYSGPQEVKQALIRVNSPLNYRGVNFYQSNFGPAAKIQASASGQILFEDSIPLTQISEMGKLQRYSGTLNLSRVGLTLQIVSAAVNGPDPVIGEDQLGVLLYREGESEPINVDVLETGVTKNLGDVDLTLVNKSQYSGFQVTSNPGNTLLWIGCALILIGLGLVFYFPFRQFWILIESKGERKSQITIRSNNKLELPKSKEITDLMNEIKTKAFNKPNQEVNHG